MRGVGGCGWSECSPDAHLPHEGAGGVFFAPALPVAPPEAVGGREGLGLHDLCVVDVTAAFPAGCQGGRLSGLESRKYGPLHVERVLEVLHEIQLASESKVGQVDI